jgi:hypothetical protein|tara:strand:- start:1996 stop:3039 length:1044 start_codon:yes stop_codon:yes gene_type:complete
MPFQKVEFNFPNDEEQELVVEVEDSGAMEIDLSGKKTAEDYKETEAEIEVEAEAEAEPEAEDEFDIEVVDDTPVADRNRKPSEPPSDVTEEELENYSKKVQNRLKHFSKSYHDERRAKEAAERERQELERLAQKLVDENKELKGNVAKNQEALLEQAKKNASSEIESAKQAYRVAYEEGNSEAVVDAQESLTSAKLKSERLNNFRIPALQEEESPVQDTEPTNTQEVYRDTRAEEWKANNSWFDTDPEMQSFALGVHQKLVNDGVDPRSDEYYERIDVRMRQVFPDQFEEEVPKQTAKRSSNVVAPATRSTKPKKVTLTPTQVALSKRLGITPQEYAKQMAALERGN